MDVVKKRILFVVGEFTLGGTACLILRHVARLIAYYDIDLFITGTHEQRMLDRIPDGVSVFVCNNINDVQAQSYLQDVVDPFRFLELFSKRNNIPILQRSYHALLAPFFIVHWWVCLIFIVVQAFRKLLFLVDDSLTVYQRGTLSERRLLDNCLLSADLVLPVSKRLWQAIGEKCPLLLQRPWQVMHPPIDDCSDVLTENLFPRSCPIVLTVARLVPGKHILESLHIHHHLRKLGINFSWYIVGDGPMMEQLREEVNKLGMADAFILVGPRQDVYRWIRQCDVFALFSTAEGCPTVVIEALAMGTPVIMTDVNGADELIDHDRTGLIVSNDVNVIADGLARMVSDAALRNKFKQNLANDGPIADAKQETMRLVNIIEDQAPIDIVPQVSILIPTYNHENYIDRAIASALMQNFVSLEVIVFDDASTDQTQSLMQKWMHDPRFKYIRHAHNIGRVANYHKALSCAQGQWVLMLDGDDYLTDASFIRDAWQAIQQHHDRPIVFVQAGHCLRHEGSNQAIHILPIIEEDEELMRAGDYLSFVFDTGFFTHLGTLYNRAVALKAGFYNKDISASDMDSLLRLSLDGDVLVLKKTVGCWAQHGNNASANVSLNQVAANVRIFRRIARLGIKRGIITAAQISKVLIQYEEHMLLSLFKQALLKKVYGPLSLLKMLAIVIFVHPRLLFRKKIIDFHYQFLLQSLSRTMLRSKWIIKNCFKFQRKNIK